MSRLRFRVSHRAVLFLVITLALLSGAHPLPAEPPTPTRQPLRRAVDLKIGESAEVTLADGKKATVKLLDLKETTDTMSHAVRHAEVSVEVNGQPARLASG